MLIDILEDRGLDVKHTSDQLVMPCPICSDHKPRLYVNPETGLWICHNCDARGNMLTLLEQVAGYDPVEAYHVAQKVGIKQKIKPQMVQAPLPIDLPEGYTPLTRDDTRSWPYIAYLMRRNVPWEGFGYTLIGKPAYRVIIPVLEHGAVQGWVARAITDDRIPKIINAPQMESGRLLYNVDAVRMEPDIVVVEGPFDALALPKRAVATFGAKMSALQRIKLRALTRNLTMMWDTDDAGIKATVKVVPELLMTGFNVRLAILREGDDASSAGPTRVGMALRNAVPVDPDWPRRKIQQLLEEGRTTGW